MSEKVYSTGSGSVYHTDPDCHCLAAAKNPTEHPRGSMEAFRDECQYCRTGPAEKAEYDWKLADPGPKLDGAILSPKDSEDNVRIGKVWTRDGFTQV